MPPALERYTLQKYLQISIWYRRLHMNRLTNRKVIVYTVRNNSGRKRVVRTVSIEKYLIGYTG